jgi:hypothetical protein
MSDKKAKFVQIMAVEESLFALDSDGVVWELDGEEDCWCPLTSKREGDGDN